MQLNSCSQGCVQVCSYLLWLQGNFPGTRGHLGRAWACMQRAQQSCPTATSSVPSAIGHQPVLCRPWPPKTGWEEGQVQLEGKMSLNKLAGSV